MSDTAESALAKKTGLKIRSFSKKGITPSQIINMEALENAITVDLALGGSTNTILHLTALAHEAEIDFDVRLFYRRCRKSPTLVKLSPGRKRPLS
ncbi:dihydroxy-acid dehydratase [Acetomicrobium sp.]|uniref:dihydroxy-acid dehydratase domain-containing protein n=1 Tax=Acetomicrobium sp. TaxID=1872099 RepID=UPI002FC6A9B6